MHGDEVQGGGVGVIGGFHVFGAFEGAGEEEGGGGPVVCEDLLQEVVVVCLRGGGGGEAVGEVGGGVVPPGAADAVLVVGVAGDETWGREAAVGGEVVRVRVAGEGDDDVALAQATRDDVGLQGGEEDVGLGLEGGLRGDEAALGGKR